MLALAGSVQTVYQRTHPLQLNWVTFRSDMGLTRITIRVTHGSGSSMLVMLTQFQFNAGPYSHVYRSKADLESCTGQYA